MWTHCCSRRTAGSWNARAGSPWRVHLCWCARTTPPRSAACSSAPACSGLNGSGEGGGRGEGGSEWACSSCSVNNLEKVCLRPAFYLWWTGRGPRCTPCSCIRRSCTSLRRVLCTPAQRWNTPWPPAQSAPLPAQTGRRCSISSRAETQPDHTVVSVLGTQASSHSVNKGPSAETT